MANPNAVNRVGEKAEKTAWENMGNENDLTPEIQELADMAGKMEDSQDYTEDKNKESTEMDFFETLDRIRESSYVRETPEGLSEADKIEYRKKCQEKQNVLAKIKGELLEAIPECNNNLEKRKLLALLSEVNECPYDDWVDYSKSRWRGNYCDYDSAIKIDSFVDSFEPDDDYSVLQKEAKAVLKYTSDDIAQGPKKKCSIWLGRLINTYSGEDYSSLDEYFSDLVDDLSSQIGSASYSENKELFDSIKRNTQNYSLYLDMVEDGADSFTEHENNSDEQINL